MELPVCPVEVTLSVIGDKWKILILRDLTVGTKRFSELRKSMPKISQKVLTQNLRSMEQDGLLNRKVYAEVPPRVEYTLTEKALVCVLCWILWRSGERDLLADKGLNNL